MERESWSWFHRLPCVVCDYFRCCCPTVTFCSALPLCCHISTSPPPSAHPPLPPTRHLDRPPGTIRTTRVSVRRTTCTRSAAVTVTTVRRRRVATTTVAMAPPPSRPEYRPISPPPTFWWLPTTSTSQTASERVVWCHDDGCRGNDGLVTSRRQSRKFFSSFFSCSLYIHCCLVEVLWVIFLEKCLV